MNLTTRYVLLLLWFLTASQGLEAQTWQNPYQERINRWVTGKSLEEAETDLKNGKSVIALRLIDNSIKWGTSLTQFTDVEQISVVVSSPDSIKLMAVFKELSQLPKLNFLKFSASINTRADAERIYTGLSRLKNLEAISLMIGGNIDFSNVWKVLPQYKNLKALQLEFPGKEFDLPVVLEECKNLRYLSILMPFDNSLPAWLGKLKSLEYLTLQGKFYENARQAPAVPKFLPEFTSLKGLEINSFEIRGADLEGISDSLQHFTVNFCTITESDKLITALNRCRHLKSFCVRGAVISPFSATSSITLPELKELVFSYLFVDSLRKQPLAFVPDFSQSLQLKTIQLEGVLGESLPKGIDQMNAIETLSLVGNNLRQLPDLGKMTKLNYLIVNNNKLEELPKSIIKSTQLKTLNLANNQLKDLPKGLSDVVGLEFIFLSNNRLVTFPGEFLKLKKLKELNVSGNKLTELPKSLGNCSSLQNLQVSNNELTALPTSIGQLKSLKFLDVSHNPLAQLPETLGNCDSLERLILANCRLETLPNSIGKLQYLNYLNLTDAGVVYVNRTINGGTMDQLPAKNHNQLRSLPTSLADCRQLKMLDLSQNKYWDEKVLWPVIQRLHMPEGTVNLSGCNLNAIPITGWLDTQIRNLYLAGNQIAQFAPDWFKAQGIKTIVLYQNKLLPRSMNREYDSFEERLLLGEEMGVEVPKPFPKTKEMARAYLKWAERKVNLGDIPRFVEYMKEAQQIDSLEARYRLELWSRFYFHTKQYRRAIDSINVVAGQYSIFDKAQSKSSRPLYLPSVSLILIDIRGQSKWKLGDSLGAIKDYEMLLEGKNFSDPNLWTRLGIWYKHYRPTAGKSGTAFDKAINMYESVQNQPPMVQLSVAEVYFMNDQADKAYEYLFGLEKSKFKPDENLLADYLLLAAQIAQKQAGEEEMEAFEKRLKSQELKIRNWSYQLFEEALSSLEYPKEQKALISRLTNAMKAQSVLVD